MKILNYLPFASIVWVIGAAYYENIVAMVSAGLVVCLTESYLAYKLLNHE